MNDEPRQKLRELIVEYGRSLCNDPNRCEALLKDYCGVHKREIFVLVSAVKRRVTDDLLKSSAGVPLEIVIGRLCKRLEDELAFTSEASHWAVESWALALGFVFEEQASSDPETGSEKAVKAHAAKAVPSLSAHETTLNLQAAWPFPTSSLVVPKIAPFVSTHQDAGESMAGRYLDNHDGTVSDMTTNLQWMRFSLGQEWNGATCIGEARLYASSYSAIEEAKLLNQQSGFAGHHDWRVPTKEELLSLVYSSSGLPKTWNDTGMICNGDFNSPTIHQPTFPNTPNAGFWSDSPGVYGPGFAWIIYFNAGYANGYVRNGICAVRLVRGG